MSGRTGPNFGGSGHLVLFLVVVYFIKRQTLPNNIPEGNLLKSVYLTPKIALISMPLMAQLYTFLFPHFYSNRITTNLSVISNNQEWRELLFMAIAFWYVYFSRCQIQNIGQNNDKSVRFPSWYHTKGVIVTLICNRYTYVIYQNDVHSINYWILQSNSKIVLRYT